MNLRALVARGLAFALATALAACGSSPTQPSETSRSGVWTGAISDAVNGAGTLRLVLEDRRIDAQQSLWTGTWTTSFPNPANNGSGTLIGGITGTKATLSLTPAQTPTCPTQPPFLVGVGNYTALELAADANRISGTYQFASCSAVVSGTLDVRR